MGDVAATIDFVAETYLVLFCGDVTEGTFVYYFSCIMFASIGKWGIFLLCVHLLCFNDINKAFMLFVCSSLSF